MAWGRSRMKNNNELSTPAGQSSSRLGLPWLMCICVAFLVLIILTGFAIMVTVLALHPHKPRYRIQDVQITQLTVSNRPLQTLTQTSDPFDAVLNSNIIVTVESYNRNHHLSIYNTRLLVILYYSGKEIGRAYFVPFHQHRQNTTVVQGVVSIRDCELRHSDSASLKAAVARNAVILQSKLAARVKFRHGIWKSSWHRWFRVRCDLVVSTITAPTGSHLLYKKC
ncbi:hypothetical protein O6H91_15G083000 [Diphasiastrum complanatum]|uniref:Uncharacterized protein n=1 Tax=Diphasiastrum complanatum TaxID=34168 RepID=A0ACC2BK77_DIPCM|nr:hypothetical protein O6H91_Y546700 [Diphasiastrum complanatum]KAJ7530174.1 hypothetical protein O6H91_15G083000 [Diphasiastrum complanatum]